jgi:hypothetical protein
MRRNTKSNNPPALTLNNAQEAGRLAYEELMTELALASTAPVPTHDDIPPEVEDDAPATQSITSRAGVDTE